MFRDNIDQEMWHQVVEQTLNIDDILPITYYKAFKFSKFYLKHHFPEMDLAEYFDKFYYAEQYFNQVQADNQFFSSVKYLDMKAYLNRKLLVFPICFMTLENLFNLHYVFSEQKIAINYFIKEHTPTSDLREPTELQKLTAKLLKYQDWEILNLTEEEFNEWKTQEKLDNIKGWLQEAKAKQIAKGITEEYKPPI